MTKQSLRLLIGSAAAAAIVTAAALQTRGQAGGTAGLPPPSAGLIALNMKFQGASSCSNAQCHGADKEKPNGDSFSNEFTMWSKTIDQQADPHHAKAWAALRNADGKKISTGLGIPDGAKSDRCLTCHALQAPDALQGKGYTLNEGITCEACHGPSEKWLEPHGKVGWYKQQTSSASFADLLKNFGLYDTRPIHARAERCTSCHLAIDPALVANGHPQPTFELNFFSDTYPNRHWHDPSGLYKVKLWAGGQQVALREALLQVAARSGAGGKALDDAYNQAMAHWAMMNQILLIIQPPGGSALGQAMQQLDSAHSGKSGLDAAAKAAADADDKLADAVEKYQPDNAGTLKMLSAISQQTDLAPKLGKNAQDQQSYAIYALYAGYADSIKPGTVASGQDKVLTDIGAKLFPDMPLTPDQFVNNLKQLQGELPK